MKISIITVCYNSASTIRDTIDSLLSQSYSNVEFIVIDGNSTDGTQEIIKSYKDKIQKYISEPDNGMYDAMNKGIKLATGEVVGSLNSDDQFFNSQCIEKIAHYFEIKGVDSIYGNLIFTDETDKIIRTWKSKPFEIGLFAKSWTPAHPTFYCKRDLFEKYGFYKSDYRIAADVELMLRFLEVNKISSYFIDEVMVKMRVGGVSNQGINSTITITKELKRAFKENGLPFNLPKYLFYKGLKIVEFL